MKDLIKTVLVVTVLLFSGCGDGVDITSKTNADIVKVEDNYALSSSGKIWRIDSSDNITLLEGSWLDLAGGFGAYFAVKSDGTLWTIHAGQVGSDQVGSDSDWSKVFVGTGNSSNYAIKTDGTLWAWGYNGSGQLGLGDFIDKDLPTQVTANVGATPFQEVIMINNFALALGTDGSLWSTGTNSSGQLGIGNTTDQNTFQSVAGTWDWIEMDNSSVFAMENNGSLLAWGYNANGQLGVNDQLTKTSPTVVPGAWSQVTFVTNTSGGVLGIKTDGTIWGWGEFSLGTTTYDSNTPAQIGSATNNQNVFRVVPLDPGTTTSDTLIQTSDGIIRWIQYLETIDTVDFAYNLETKDQSNQTVLSGTNGCVRDSVTGWLKCYDKVYDQHGIEVDPVLKNILILE